MSLFSFALKKSLEKLESYYEITDKVKINNPVKSFFRSIIITSDIDAKIGKDDEFVIKMFATKNTDDKSLKVNCSISEDILYIKISSDNKNIKAYIYICVPQKLDFLKVNSENTDISLTRIKCELLKLKSVNGDICVNKSDFNECKIKTDNGDINILLNSESYKIKTSIKSGDVILHDVKNDSSSKLLISCSSNSGNIIIKK